MNGLGRLVQWVQVAPKGVFGNESGATPFSTARGIGWDSLLHDTCQTCRQVSRKRGSSHGSGQLGHGEAMHEPSFLSWVPSPTFGTE